LEEGVRVFYTTGVEFEREEHSNMFPRDSRGNQGNVAIVTCVLC